MVLKITEDCLLCGKCKEVCECDAIEELSMSYEINQEKCDGCGECCDICPIEAIVKMN